MSRQTLRVSSNPTGQIVQGVLVTAGITVATILLYKGAQGLGIIPSKYDRKLRKLNGFDPNYYKTRLQNVTISTATADRIAYDIKMSYGFASSSPELQGGNKGILGGVFETVYGTATALKDIGTGEYNFGNDDEIRLYTAIAEARSQVNLSKVSDVFQRRYGEPMIDYIMKFANNPDTKEMYHIIKSYQ